MAHSIGTGDTCESPSPVIVKRKRTKRHHTLPPPPSATAASSASSNSTELEHNTADYLILLARGEAINPAKQATRPADPVPPSSFILYRCKTCDKCFSTFQALGGHRASHKKPKASALETELMSSAPKPIASSPTLGGEKQRSHECSICRSEFSSGQALGGHMRRHRPAVPLENGLKVNKKQKSFFLLDLNLPAPADDEPFVIVKPLPCSPPVLGYPH